MPAGRAVGGLDAALDPITVLARTMMAFVSNTTFALDLDIARVCGCAQNQPFFKSDTDIELQTQIFSRIIYTDGFNGFRFSFYLINRNVRMKRASCLLALA